MVEYSYIRTRGVIFLELSRLDPKPKFNKTILIIVLIAAASLCGFIYYYNNQVFNFNRLFTGKVNTNYKTVINIPFNPSDNLNFLTYDNKILWVAKDTVKAITTNNKVEWEIKNSLSNPIVKVEDKYLLMADQGGKSLYLYQGDKKLWNKTLSSAITNVKLYKSGYVLVFCQNDNNTEIIGYSVKGIEIIRKPYQNQTYLINADISSDNKKVAVLSVYTEKSKVGSKIDFYEIKSTCQVNSVPISGTVKEDVLASDIKIFENGNIVLVGDNKIIAIDNKGNDKWLKDYGAQRICKANINSANYIVLEVNSTSRSSFFENKRREVQVINADGVLEGEPIKITSQVNNIDAFENYFITNDSSRIYSITKGKLIWSCVVDKDIKYAKAFKGKSQLLLIRRDSIEVIQVN